MTRSDHDVADLMGASQIALRLFNTIHETPAKIAAMAPAIHDGGTGLDGLLDFGET